MPTPPAEGWRAALKAALGEDAGESQPEAERAAIDAVEMADLKEETEALLLSRTGRPSSLPCNREAECSRIAPEVRVRVGFPLKEAKGVQRSALKRTPHARRCDCACRAAGGTARPHPHAELEVCVETPLHSTIELFYPLQLPRVIRLREAERGRRRLGSGKKAGGF